MQNNDNRKTEAMATRLPLTGVKVLDLSRVLAGPYATMILADLGAEVVKIEQPEVGDDARHFGPFLSNGDSAYFASINRGKRSMVLDLRTDTGRQTLMRLAEKADVLVENFRPGLMESFGLGSPTLRQKNPRLIFVSASGYGRGGARGHRGAYDVVIQAMSGLMSITGTETGHTVRVGSSISDILTGLFTAIGILAALRGRDNTGIGSDLDIAMLDCTVATLENAVSRYEVTGQVPQPLGTRHPSIAPFQAFATADGQIVIAAGNDHLWKRLCEAMSAPELISDPLLVTNADRSANLGHLDQEMERRLRTRSTAEWLDRLEAVGIPCAPIRNIADVANDPELAARGMLHRMTCADTTSFLTAGSPFHIDGGPPPLSPHAPQLGEHTAEISRDWLS